MFNSHFKQIFKSVFEILPIKAFKSIFNAFVACLFNKCQVDLPFIYLLYVNIALELIQGSANSSGFKEPMNSQNTKLLLINRSNA